MKLYEPSKNAEKDSGPWYEVISVNRILGIAPLAPNYEHVEATIPYQAGKRQQACFPHGKADSSSKHDGSRTYYLNTFALRFGHE